MSGVRVSASIAAPQGWRRLEAGVRNVRPSQAARALALAYYVDQALEDGRYVSAGEVADALGVTRARVSQVLALLLLPTKVQEAVLLGEVNPSPRELRISVQFMTTTVPGACRTTELGPATGPEDG